MNEELPAICPYCNSLINKENNLCECGIWIPEEKVPDYLKKMKDVLECFDWLYDQKQLDKVISGCDQEGNGILVFKGDEEICKQLKAYYYSLIEE